MASTPQVGDAGNPIRISPRVAEAEILDPDFERSNKMFRRTLGITLVVIVVIGIASLANRRARGSCTVPKCVLIPSEDGFLPDNNSDCWSWDATQAYWARGPYEDGSTAPVPDTGVNITFYHMLRQFCSHKCPNQPLLAHMSNSVPVAERVNSETKQKTLCSGE